MSAPRLRPARRDEAEAIAALIRRSITELCARDHGGDPALLGPWLANKTAEGVARWFDTPGQRITVAEIGGVLAGVAAAREDGEVVLNYVSPDFSGRGVSAALLAELEGWMRGLGVREARLDSTATALDFYRVHGYRRIELADTGVQTMRKSLGPATALVIFDCDGVLVDSESLSMRILLETIRGAGLSLDPAIGYDLFLGRSLASVGQTLREDFGVTLDEVALAEMRQRLYAAFRDELRPVPGVADTLSALGVPVCVASSSQPERVELSLRLTGLWPWFEGRVFSATMVRQGKPAPDLFLFAAERMGYDPETCLVVEDSPAGLSAARAAGMRVVGFTGGDHAERAMLEARLAPLGPDGLMSDMRELVGFVRGKG